MDNNLYTEYKKQGREDVDLQQVLSKQQLEEQLSGSQGDLEVAWMAYQEGSGDRQVELEQMEQEVNQADLRKEVDYYDLGYQEGQKCDVDAPKENDSELAEKSGLEPETGPFYDWVWGYHSAINHKEVLEQQYKEMDRQQEVINDIEEQREIDGHDEPCQDYSMYM